jgi:hypothetical protein
VGDHALLRPRAHTLALTAAVLHLSDLIECEVKQLALEGRNNRLNLLGKQVRAQVLDQRRGADFDAFHRANERRKVQLKVRLVLVHAAHEVSARRKAAAEQIARGNRGKHIGVLWRRSHAAKGPRRRVLARHRLIGPQEAVPCERKYVARKLISMILLIDLDSQFGEHVGC